MVVLFWVAFLKVIAAFNDAFNDAFKVDFDGPFDTMFTPLGAVFKPFGENSTAFGNPVIVSNCEGS